MIASAQDSLRPDGIIWDGILRGMVPIAYHQQLNQEESRIAFKLARNALSKSFLTPASMSTYIPISRNFYGPAGASRGVGVGVSHGDAGASHETQKIEKKAPILHKTTPIRGKSPDVREAPKPILPKKSASRSITKSPSTSPPRGLHQHTRKTKYFWERYPFVDETGNVYAKQRPLYEYEMHRELHHGRDTVSSQRSPSLECAQRDPFS